MQIKNKIISLINKTNKYTGLDMSYIITNTFWVNLNIIITTILSLIVSILFANFINKETFGTYQFFISISSLIGALTLTGMNPSVTQAVSRGIEGVLKQSIKTQLKWVFVPFLIGIMISIYYLLQNNTSVFLTITLISLILPISNSLNTWSAYLTGKKNFRSAFYYNQIINVLNYGGIIFSIFFFPNATFLIFAGLTMNLLGNLFSLYYINKKDKPNNKNEDEAINYGEKLSFSNILPILALHIDNIVIFHLLGPKDLAIYAFASNIPEKFMSIIRSISIVYFPKLSEKTDIEVSKLLPKKIKQFAILAIFFGLVYILLTPFIYKIVFPQYIESINYSRVYIIAVILSTISTLSITSLFATRSSNIFKFNVINPIFNISIMVIGGYTYGILGVIFGRIIGNIFSLIISFNFSQIKN